MRKLIFPIIICMIAIIACSSSSSSSNETPVNKTESISAITDDKTDGGDSTIQVEDKSGNKVSVAEQILVDKDGLVITLLSLESDSFWGPSLKILIENNTAKTVTIQTRNSAINGVMIDTIFSSDVAPGKKANDDIAFSASDLDIASIETIKDIEFFFHVFDSETWDEIFDSETISITTSADPSFIQPYDDSGYIALNQNNIKIVIKKLESEGSFWGADVYAYIENNSDQDVTIQVRDVSVNGFMVDPIFSSDVLSGKKAFDTITFLESDLKDNSIETIESLELYFHIFNIDTWDTIFDSGVVTISFTN